MWCVSRNNNNRGVPFPDVSILFCTPLSPYRVALFQIPSFMQLHFSKHFATNGPMSVGGPFLEILSNILIF